MPNRRAVLQSSLAAATLMGARPDAGVGAQARVRNVRDFGAKGDGITDDTEAFNRATRADEPWSWDMLSSIIVPAGRYRIDGTVYLRKGQSLIGDGLSTYIDAAKASGSVFIMGRRRKGARGVEDPGGLPVRVERFIGLGGVADQGFIFAAIPGFQISGLFLTAVGIGIEIEGADGIISDIEVDQCLSAIQIRKSQNIVLTNLNFYLANYGISMFDKCNDICISNSVFCYTKYATVLLGDRCAEIRSISIAGCTFTNNVAYKTFSGYIYSRASDSDMLVTGCTFRNAPGYAVNQDAGVDVRITLRGCTFNGMRSRGDYNQSLDSKGIRTGQGTFSLSDCLFQNLQEAIRVYPYLKTLEVDGGSFDQVGSALVAMEHGATGPISIRAARGLATVKSSPAGHDVSLPYMGPSTRLQVTINARTATAPILTAHFSVVCDEQGVMAKEIWSSGRGGASASPSIAAEVRDGSIHLLLEARRYGSALPSVDVEACC
jgi:hypothetical protein